MIDPRPTRSADAPEATSGVAALIARIESSPIMPRGPAPAGWAPAGYDEADIRMLEWIASHRQSPRRVMPAEMAA